MSMGPKADSADLQPVASAKSPIRPDHSHWLPGAYSQKLGGKFAQRFCDATLNKSLTVSRNRAQVVDSDVQCELQSSGFRKRRAAERLTPVSSWSTPMRR